MASGNTIAFGSCNKQYRSQKFWNAIKSFNPSLFIWTGDAVYAKKGNKIEIDGVWDDHDYGVNDAGRIVPYRTERQQEYLQFIYNNSINSDTNQYSTLVKQDGLYHTHDINLSGLNVKFILLDTRSHRDKHFIPSFGEYDMKGSAIIASALRAAYTLLGIGRRYNGKVLGDAQWLWLEDILLTSTADVNIIVSSIQVMTSNPVFESWGHFPIEQQKLQNLIAKANRNNVYFISGDVHLAEFLKANYKLASGEQGNLVEITSSGLTHTCSDGIINQLLCPLMMSIFNKHRLNNKLLYLGKNFGLIKATPLCNNNDDNTCSNSSKYSLEFLIQSINEDSTYSSNILNKIFIIDKYNNNSSTNITSVEFPQLQVLPTIVFKLIAVLIVAILYVILIKRKNKKKSYNNDKKMKKY